MNKLNLNLLITFYTVIKKKSFSLAADELQLSKSVISKQVKQLETELQCTLIHRTTRTLSLTEEGRYLYDSYSKIIDDVKRCHDFLDQKNSTVSGALNIRLPIVLEHDIELMAKISSFAKSYPQLELEITYGYTLDDMITEGIDLAFHIGELPDSSLKCRKVKDIGTLVVCSPSYIQEYGLVEKPHDLNSHRCMNYRSCLTKDKWRFNLANQSHEFIKLKSTIRSDSEFLLIEMARNGVGIACALDFLVTDYIGNGELVTLIEDYTWSTELLIVYPSTSVVPNKVRTFIDYLLSNTNQNIL